MIDKHQNTIPIRIQRKRVKGFRMPENSSFVDRPSKWGNPMKIESGQIFIDAYYRRTILGHWVILDIGKIKEKDLTKKMIELYEGIVEGETFKNPDLQHWSDQFKKLNISELTGKNLCYYCRLDQDCHTDVLLRLANIHIKGLWSKSISENKVIPIK